MFRPDGEEVWLRDSSVLVLSDRGHRLAWQGVIEDITTRAACRGRDPTHRRPAIERSSSGCPRSSTRWGRTTNARRCSSARTSSRCSATREANGSISPTSGSSSFTPTIERSSSPHHDRHSETGEPWDLEYRLIASDGRVVWVHDRAILIGGRERGAAAWHGVMIDITAEHDAREMLVLHKEDLERRVAERTNELQETQRADGPRDRRAPTDGGRGPAGRGAVPAARREHARHRLHLGGASRRGPLVRLRESAPPGRARVLTRGMARLDPRSTRTIRREWPRPSPERADRRTVPDGVPLPREGRQRRLGPRPCLLDLAGREREIRPRSRG